MSLTANYPQVSTLISTYNRCKLLKRCLDSIAHLDYPKGLLELIVLDDASEDSTPQEIPRYLEHLKEFGFKRVYFFRSEKNLNISHARYILGSRVSPETEMILFVDDDAYLEGNCLKILVEYMLRDPKIGIIGPRIVHAENPKQTIYFANFIGGWTARYRSKESGEPIVCDWINSTCCLVKKKVLEEVGGFYPGYYTAHEEVDFCFRIKKLGFKVVYHPYAIAYHEIDLTQSKRERLYYLYRNKLLLIHRNFPLFRKIIAISLIFFFGLPKYLWESIRFNKKLAPSELKLIFLSFWHGLLGKIGSQKKETKDG